MVLPSPPDALRPALGVLPSAVLALACTGPPAEPPVTTAPASPADSSLSGVEADDGFGSALAGWGDRLWIGAPHGTEGRVHLLEEGVLREVLAGDGRLGATVAAGAWGAVAGAPLAADGGGELWSADGERLARGDGEATPPEALGTALWGDEAGWVAASAGGWRDSTGASGTSERRPTAVARRGSSLLLGHALGDRSLSLDGGPTRDRDAVGDGEGTVILAAELDGAPVWLAGRPGAGRVRAWSAELGEILGELAAPEGSRGFGASLAVADWDGDGSTELLVGAPGSGDEVEGAAFLYELEGLGSEALPIRTWTGERPGEQLGVAVALLEGCAAMGAPGTPDAPGRVLLSAP